MLTCTQIGTKANLPLKLLMRNRALAAFEPDCEAPKLRNMGIKPFSWCSNAKSTHGVFE
jgi:hypothetical protein